MSRRWAVYGRTNERGLLRFGVWNDDEELPASMVHEEDAEVYARKLEYLRVASVEAGEGDK